MKRGIKICRLLILLLCILSVFVGCKKSESKGTASQTEQVVEEALSETKLQEDAKKLVKSEVIGTNEDKSIEETVDAIENSLDKKDDKDFKSEISNNNTKKISFDMEKISQQIKINNKNIPFPCTLKDLGEVYGFGKFFFPFDADSKGELTYQGDTNFSISLYNYKDKKPDENALIYDMYGTIYDKFPFEIAEITYGSTTKDLIDKFGEPTYIGGNVEEGNFLYEYKIHNYQYMIFDFDGEKIMAIEFRYLPDQYLEGRDLYE